MLPRRALRHPRHLRDSYGYPRRAVADRRNAHSNNRHPEDAVMFGTSKAIIKRALVVAVWGATLIAPQASAADASASPGSAADVGAVWVTGDVQPVDGTCSSRDNGSDSGVTRSTYTCTQTSTSSDPRLTGTVTKSWNE